MNNHHALSFKLIESMNLIECKAHGGRARRTRVTPEKCVIRHTITVTCQFIV